MPRLLTALVCLLVATPSLAGLPQDTPTSKPSSLRYVPDSSVFLLSVHPSEVILHKSVKPMADELKSFFSNVVHTDLEKLETWQLGLFFIPDKENNRTREGVYQIFVSKEPTDFTGLVKVMAPSGQKLSHKGVEYFRSNRACYLLLGDRTLLLAENERSMLPLIEAGAASSGPARWKPHWDKLKGKPAACMIDFANFKKAVENNPPPPGIFSDIKPMWEKSQLAAIGLDLTKRVELNAVAESMSEEDATAAKKAMNVGLGFARSQFDEAMQQIDQQIDQLSNDAYGEGYVVEMRIVEAVMSLIRKPMAAIEIQQDGKTLTASTSLSPIAIGRASGKVAPLLRTIQAKAVASARQNNLRQIALAMHNYHDVYNEFPPAYKMGKDGNGNHKVSWRVLILPFLEELNLYEQYKFDEPWDSPANKRVTARMPAVFRAIGSKAAAMETDYFAIVGENTAFKPEKGRKLAEFIDGTSNSLLVVESRKAVHWAKPEDIALPKDKLPKLGGIAEKGFRMVRADGSAGFVLKSADPEQLRRLLTINDGKVTDSSLVGTEPVEDE